PTLLSLNSFLKQSSELVWDLLYSSLSDSTLTEPRIRTSFSIRNHTVTLRFLLSPGQTSDVVAAESTLHGLSLISALNVLLPHHLPTSFSIIRSKMECFLSPSRTQQPWIGLPKWPRREKKLRSICLIKLSRMVTEK